jgi:hypothetical protein
MDNKAPLAACTFKCQGVEIVQLAAGGDTSNRFKIVAYDGRIIQNHWFWGNLAFDIAGLFFENEKATPVFDSHDYRIRLGYADTQKIQPAVTFEGPFLDNTDAQSLRSDMRKGFPMQASLGLDPMVVEQVAAGASVTVNGHTLKGPGAVFRQAGIREVSMCPFGAAPDTSSTAFADDDSKQIEFQLLGKDIPMKNQETPALTVETFKAENPTLHEQILAAGKTEGVAAEGRRFAALKAAAGEDMALAVQAFENNWDVAATLQERNVRLAAQLKEAHARLAAKPPANTAAAATAEFVSQPAPQSPEKAFDEATATDEQLAAHFAATPDVRDRFSSAKAYIACVRHPPKALK